MPWIQAKIDWKETDSANFADFNRIENNTVELANILASNSYRIPSLTTVANRTNAYVDYVSSINRIERNIDTIRLNFATTVDWKSPKTWGVGIPFTFQEMNRLEQNLKSMYELVPVAVANFRYAGTQTTGNNWGLIY